MTLKNRRKLIEEVNNAFIEFIRDYRDSRFTSYFKEINKKIIADIENLTPNRVAQIVQETDLNVEDIAIYSALLGAITTILENKRLNKKQRENLAPILIVAGAYSLSNPKRFVNNVQKSLSNPTSKTQKLVRNNIDKYIEANRVAVDRIKIEQVKMLKDSQLKAKIAQSQDMIKEMSEMTLQGKPIEMQKNWLQRKYNGSKTINRVIDTEVHSALEKGKEIQAVADGFEFKTWKTQGDDRVRSTRWHNHVRNMKIGINEEFRLGNMIATAPGDERLPVGERINCRCYLIFT
jgi:hypothetical protein